MERKKIVPKAKLDASRQEELLKKLQQDTENTVNLQQNTVTPDNKPITVETPPVNLQQNTAKAVKDSTDTDNAVLADKNTKVQRITVDMPIDLYEKMKTEVEDNGQTIKGFIVNLVRSHFKKIG